MSVLERALRDAARHLDALDVRWALVGGLAGSARATPRTTRDVDVAIADAVERRRCEDALAMITARNCARERDLFAAWRAVLDDA